MKFTDNRGASTLIILIIVLALLGAGGYFGYTKYYLPRQYGNTFTKDLKYISLKEEILFSTYENLPVVYADLVEINNELLVINEEIDRLTKMEKEFPQQKEIIISEKGIWESLQEHISNTINSMENELETLYVAHRVNAEKGMKRLGEKRSELQNTIKQTLKTSQEKTKRLKPPPDNNDA